MEKIKTTWVRHDWSEVQTVEYKNYKIVVYLKVDIVCMVVEKILFGYEILDPKGEVIAEAFDTEDNLVICGIEECLENAKSDVEYDMNYNLEGRDYERGG